MKAKIARLSNTARDGFHEVLECYVKLEEEPMNREEMFDKRLLIRDILNTLWVIIGLYLLGTGIHFFLTTYDKWLFFLEVILFPFFKFITVMLCAELYMHKLRKHQEYFIMIVITLFISIIIVSIYDKVILMVLLITPVLVSLFFYNKRIIRFSVFISILTFLVIYFFYEPIHAYMDTADLIIIILILLGISLLINSLMKHSDQVMKELLKTTKEKNDLFSKNIQMERLTRLDPVTELYNHRSFHEQLDSIVGLRSPEELTVHVAVLDIDNFKQINDTFGHRAGDSVIMEVARQIKFYSVGDDFPSRYGGEEFGLISMGTSEEDFIKRVENIRESIANTSFPKLKGRHVTISIGVQKLLPGMNKEDLFKGADTALYTAKRTGKNKTVIN